MFVVPPAPSRVGARALLAGAAVLALLVPGIPSAAADRPSPSARPTTAPASIKPATPPRPRRQDLLPGNREILSTVRDLVGFAPRVTGSPGGRRTAAYVADRFRRAGLSDVHYEKAPSYWWRSSDDALRVDGKRIPATPIRHSLIAGFDKESHRTLGAKGLTAPIVDIGATLPTATDIEGKIVVFDLKFLMPLGVVALASEFLWDPDLQLLDPEALLGANPYMTNYGTVMPQIIDGGAVGAIGVLADYFESDDYHNESYRQVEMKIPGFWVSPDTGAKLRASLASDSRATMHLTTDRTQVVGRTVVGLLPGRTKQTIMVQSHHDSQGPGAVEDGTGAAEVIALADYYGALARTKGYTKPEKTLMFATFDSHFTGYQNHGAFARKYVLDPDPPLDIVANATIEHIGLQAKKRADGSLRVLDMPEPSGIFENLGPSLKAVMAGGLIQNDIRATALLNAVPMQTSVGVPTDANWAVLSQIPTASMISGPAYMYDDADTLDKVDVDRLAPVARLFVQIIDAMQATPSDLIGMVPPPVADVIREILVLLLFGGS